MVTTSTTEAELLALSATAKETIAILGLIVKEYLELTTKLHHVDIHHFWLRQAHQQSIVKIQWTPTTEMIADGMTKSLIRQGHDHFIKQLRITKKAL